MHPPPGTNELWNTHIREAAIGKLPIPLVLYLCDLAAVFIVEDVDSTCNGLLLPNSFDDIAGLKIHADWIAAVDNFVVEAFYFFECYL